LRDRMSSYNEYMTALHYVLPIITAELTIPTIGIGAGPSCDGQVLVWQDMAGLSGFAGKFVKAYAQLGAELERAASAYHDEVAERSEEHTAELQVKVRSRMPYAA